VTAALPLPTCASCLGGVPTFEVRSGSRSERLDAAAIRAALDAGTLAGTDLVVDGGGHPVPIAAHPAFRAWFLDGYAEARSAPGRPAGRGATVAPAAGPRAARRRTPVLLLGGAVLLAVAAAVAFVAARSTDGRPLAMVAVRAELPVAPSGVPAPGPATPAPTPAEPHPFDALVARVGDVEEPRALLLAEAWAKRNAGGAEALAAAVVAAERAVVRAPGDVEALALLAFLYAESGAEPVLRKALVERAARAAPKAPAVLRAAARVAIADGAADSVPLAEDCLAAAPADLGCREVVAVARELAAVAPKLAEAENLVYAYDELARAWPENRHLPRRAALFAARTELVGAEARLAAEAKRTPKDAELLAARALLAFRAGTAREGRALLANVASPGDALLVEAAGEAVGRGAAAEALALVARVQRPTRASLLYEAQARLLAARAGKGSPAEAMAAADRLAAVDGSGAATAQVRVLVALLAGDTAAAARAWDKLPPKDAPAVDLARAWLARSALDLSLGHPREALLGADTALQWDSSDPNAYLWRAAALVASQNGPGAVDALRAAVVHVDGSHARRRAYGSALPVPADTTKLRAELEAALARDPARQDALAVALAVVDWLAGDRERALAGLAPVTARGSDADAFALEARLLLASGQHERSLASADRALSLRPREVAWQVVRAEALLALGRAADAERAVALARSGALPAASLHLLTARIAAMKGDSAAALVARRAAAAADPTDLVVVRALRGVSED